MYGSHCNVRASGRMQYTGVCRPIVTAHNTTVERVLRIYNCEGFSINDQSSNYRGGRLTVMLERYRVLVLRCYHPYLYYHAQGTGQAVNKYFSSAILKRLNAPRSRKNKTLLLPF